MKNFETHIWSYWDFLEFFGIFRFRGICPPESRNITLALINHVVSPVSSVVYVQVWHYDGVQCIIFCWPMHHWLESSHVSSQFHSLETNNILIQNLLGNLVFWKGHIIWKNLPLGFDIYSVTSNQVGHFFKCFGLLRIY